MIDEHNFCFNQLNLNLSPQRIIMAWILLSAVSSVLFLICCSLAQSNNNTTFGNMEPFTPMNLFYYLEMTEYDRTVHPNNNFYNNSVLTHVNVSLVIESIGNLKIKEMEFDVDMYLVEQWYDPRLNPNNLPLDSDHEAAVPLSDWKLLDKIWRPDLYFSNSKETTYNDVTVPNMHMRIQRNGIVRWSVRIASTFACHMDLHKYPFDKQTCHIKMSTYANQAYQVQLDWLLANKGLAIELNEDIEPAEYKLEKHWAAVCTNIIEKVHFSCLEAVFEFERARIHYIMLVYLPSAAIVCISWISFWIDPAAIPGRVSLCITTLLTLSTQAAGLAYRLPQVGYAKAQDIWMLGCLTSLFATLLEFSFVSAMATKAEQREQDYMKLVKVKVAARKLSQAVPEPPSLSSKSLGSVMRRIKPSTSSQSEEASKTPLISKSTASKSGHDGSKGGVQITQIEPEPDMPIGEDLLAKAELYSRVSRYGDYFARVAFPIMFLVFSIVYFHLFY